MNKTRKGTRKGFTLLEILLVIALIGILAAIVLVAINPNRQIAQARNAQRRSDINTIYKGLEQYLIDNKEYPEGIDNKSKDICINGNTINCVNLGVLVPTYLAAIPKDPSGGVYKVYKNSENNRIGVEATGSELGQSIVLNPISRPPVAGAILWVDASTLATGTGINAATTAVLNLGSQDGTFNLGGYDVVSNGIGSKNALRFNGTNQYLRSTDAYTNTGTALTMFVVSQRITTGEEYDGYLSCIFPNTKDFGDIRSFTYSQGSGGGFMYGERTGSLPGITHAGNGVPFIGTLKFDGTNVTHYQKTPTASTSSTAGKSGTFGCTTTALAARQAGDNPSGSIGNLSNIFIGEVLIYNSALSDTDRLSIISYLSTKWGIGS